MARQNTENDPPEPGTEIAGKSPLPAQPHPGDGQIPDHSGTPNSRSGRGIAWEGYHGTGRLPRGLFSPRRNR